MVAVVRLCLKKDFFDSHKSAMKPLDFKYLTLSGGICYQDGASNITVHTKIKIQKDSIIWFSLSVLGYRQPHLTKSIAWPTRRCLPWLKTVSFG